MTSERQTDATGISRGGFLRTLGVAATAAALGGCAQTHPAAATRRTLGDASDAKPYDLRDFIRWFTDDFEPSVRLPGPAGSYMRTPGQTAIELYGISDMACILYTLGRLRPTEKERQEWADGFQSFQVPGTGMLVEKGPPTHNPLHNTAFALAAMQLLDLRPKNPVTMGPEYTDPRAFLQSLNWKTAVYTESHKGAGIGAIYALVPELGTPQWFAEYFATTDSLFDPHNGLMGIDKPPTGDNDQIGGSFHYSFLYEYFNRQPPFGPQRIDTVLRLQQPDGHWDKTNHNWMTLDAIYLMTRTLRYAPHRTADVHRAVRKTMDTLMQDMYSPAARKTAYSGRLAVHSVTAAVSIAAELQKFLGADQVITEMPLHLVLDRRPFI